MKRNLSVCLLFSSGASLFTGCKEKDDMIEITLNEVAHSVFYAPMYVALKRIF